ncbi:hypothetical protein COLO4_14639 [Corchorus olitorius]|uniref:F-box domain-containing protein n=1 Tax=Corchorus olitorius TaxID=93759 RepID=A0A1R3JRV5_9ROSI|nr:hypothetical protein COLO4_14639 [Corchorus olitorius]
MMTILSKIKNLWGKPQGKKKEDLWGRGLPPELLELILSKLIFVVDIQKFHSVCKTWRSITVSVPSPRQLPSPLPYADSSFPLLFQIMDDHEYRVLHPLYNYTWNMQFPPQVGDGPKRIYFSKHGWSLMLQFNREPILFNPLTQEIIFLPTVPVFPGYSPCILFFTCPPSQPDCSIVAIVGDIYCSIYVHKLGEDYWKKHELKGKMDRYFEPICHPILYQGLCYCLDQKGNLAVFDIQDIENSWIIHEKIIPESQRKVPAPLTALVEHNGQLLVVFIESQCRPYIFKYCCIFLSKGYCVPMKSLGKKALFISEGASFSQRAIVSGTGNKIFGPFLKNGSFHFYSLATRKYHSFFDNLSSNDDLWGKLQGEKKEDLWGKELPPELLELILSKLIFVVDIINFHAVCKTWRSITVSVSPPRQLPSILTYADSSFPLLFQIMDDRSKYRVMHPLYKYTWDMDFPPEVGDGTKRIYFSKYGWSLMLRSYRHPVLFNPLTQEIIQLPTVPGIPESMLFTCPPSQPDCLVVAISVRNTSIYVHQLGEANWKEHDLKGKMDPSFEPLYHPILYQGLCYCLDWNRNLAVFDIQDIQHTWIVHKEVIPSTNEVPAFPKALAEHDGQLLVILIGLRRPYILELDLKRKSCVLMQNLGKNTLFISDAASFSQRAIASGTGNKLFAPYLNNKTDSFNFYSLATRKYHPFFDRDTKLLLYSSWLPM